MKGIDWSLKEQILFWSEAIYCKTLLIINRSMKKLPGFYSVILPPYEYIKIIFNYSITVIIRKHWGGWFFFSTLVTFIYLSKWSCLILNCIICDASRYWTSTSWHPNLPSLLAAAIVAINDYLWHKMPCVEIAPSPVDSAGSGILLHRFPGLALKALVNGLSDGGLH